MENIAYFSSFDQSFLPLAMATSSNSDVL